MQYSRLKVARRWAGLTAALAMAAGVLVIVMVLILKPHELDQVLPLLIAGLTLALLGGMLIAVFSALFKIEANSHRLHDVLVEMQDVLHQHLELTKDIKLNSQISEAAKSLGNRELERDALRKAIREDILREDWEAAYSLIEEMEERFGYRIESYNYRKEVDEFRKRAVEDKITTSLQHARELAAVRDWDQARAETERLLKLAPNDPRVPELIEELSLARESHKQKLLDEWQHAVARKDLDRSIELLKQVDPYLSSEETKKLEDSARSIFKAKLLDLGMQFRSAVKEKRWADAVGVGEQIREEFPNSQMAREVNESLPTLRTKASVSGASATSPPD